MSPKSFKGAGASPGIAIGDLVVHETRPISVVKSIHPASESDNEVRRFDSAVEGAVRRILENRDRANREMGEEYGAIFEAHHLIASDSALLDPVRKIIRSEHANAEWALEQVVCRLVEKFEALPDAYLVDRKLDILDVSGQILKELHGYSPTNLTDLDRQVVLIADDLSPSTTVKLPLDKILGFVLETGGPTSHTTIIARSLGIPVIVGAHGVCDAAVQASRVILDAFEGKILFDPNPAEEAEYQSRRKEYLEQQAHFQQIRILPTITRDGHTITLLANIDLQAEMEQANHWNVEGIGLYRSEFLYMERSPLLPTESEHCAVYRQLLRAMGDKPVTIRTFDLGGKKLAREVVGSDEANPVLGLRGIRLCFSKPEFFQTQLRALLRVAAEFPAGRLRIMFPLISGLQEFRVARLLVRRLTQTLREQGCAVPDGVPIGAMVEVPSAAVMAKELAKEADFLSIGTNDLIQYSLAVDRGNDLVADLYRPTNPAVLRLISHVIDSGKDAGIDVAVCGEMASDPLMLPLLVGLGLTRFSMNPQALPQIRSMVRQLSFRQATVIARQAVLLTTADEVEEFLLERLAISLAKIKIRV